MTFTDEIERSAGRVFLDFWKRRLEEKGSLIFFLADEQRKDLIAERRAYRLAEAVWKEGAAEC